MGDDRGSESNSPRRGRLAFATNVRGAVLQLDDRTAYAVGNTYPGAIATPVRRALALLDPVVQQLGPRERCREAWCWMVLATRAARIISLALADADRIAFGGTLLPDLQAALAAGGMAALEEAVEASDRHGADAAVVSESDVRSLLAQLVGALEQLPDLAGLGWFRVERPWSGVFSLHPLRGGGAFSPIFVPEAAGLVSGAALVAVPGQSSALVFRDAATAFADPTILLPSPLRTRATELDPAIWQSQPFARGLIHDGRSLVCVAEHGSARRYADLEAGQEWLHSTLPEALASGAGTTYAVDGGLLSWLGSAGHAPADLMGPLGAPSTILLTVRTLLVESAAVTSPLRARSVVAFDADSLSRVRIRFAAVGDTGPVLSVVEGASTAGANTAGANTAGANTAGANTAGASTAGANTAGASTAGASTAGASTAGANTAGANNPGTTDMTTNARDFLKSALSLRDGHPLGEPELRIDSYALVLHGAALSYAELTCELELWRAIDRVRRGMVGDAHGSSLPPVGVTLRGGAVLRPALLDAATRRFVELGGPWPAQLDVSSLLATPLTAGALERLLLALPEAGDESARPSAADVRALASALAYAAVRETRPATKARHLQCAVDAGFRDVAAALAGLYLGPLQSPRRAAELRDALADADELDRLPPETLAEIARWNEGVSRTPSVLESVAALIQSSHAVPANLSEARRLLEHACEDATGPLAKHYLVELARLHFEHLGQVEEAGEIVTGLLDLDGVEPGNLDPDVLLLAERVFDALGDDDGRKRARDARANVAVGEARRRLRPQRAEPPAKVLAPPATMNADAAPSTPSENVALGAAVDAASGAIKSEPDEPSQGEGIAVAIDPLAIAEASLAAGQLEEARRLLENEARRIEAEDDAAIDSALELRLWSLIGDVRERLGDDVGAAGAFERVLSSDFISTVALEGLSRIAERDGDLATALGHVHTLLRLADARGDTVAQERLGGVRRRLEGRTAAVLTAVRPDGDASETAALAAEARGDLAEAELRWRDVVESSVPGSPSIASLDVESARLVRFNALVALAEVVRRARGPDDDVTAWLTEAHQIRPDSKAVVFRLIEVARTRLRPAEAARWLEALTTIETVPERLARVFTTLAMLYQNELARPHDARLFAERAIELHSEREAWDVLEAAVDSVASLPERLAVVEARLSEPGDAELLKRLAGKRIDLLTEGGAEPYRIRPALVDALRLDPTNADLIEAMARLQEREPHDPSDAIALYRRVLEQSPRRVSAYRGLGRLLARRRDRDAAWCIATVLTHLDAADMPEREFTEKHRRGLLAVKRPLDGQAAWDAFLVPESQDPVLTRLLELVGRTLGPSAFPMTLADADLRPGDRLPMKDTGRFQDFLRTASKILDVPLPGVYRKAGAPLVSKVPLFPPVLVISPDFEFERKGKELRFLIGKALAFFLPGHQLAGFASGAALPALSSQPRLRELQGSGFIRALLLGSLNAGADEPATIGDPGVLAAREALAARLRKSDWTSLRELVHLLETRDVGPNAGAWLSGVEQTANRAGLLLSNDLDVAVRMLELEHATGTAWSKLPIDAAVDDLLRYSVSERYFSLRRALGAAIEG